MELVYPHLNGVHGTFAIGPSHVLFVGMGGKIVDEPESTRLEGERLRYPAWEVEYRLKTIGELKDYEKVFLFATQPAHKGLHAAGSETLAELINTYRPQLAVVAGNGVAETRLGRMLLGRQEDEINNASRWLDGSGVTLRGPGAARRLHGTPTPATRGRFAARRQLKNGAPATA